MDAITRIELGGLPPPVAETIDRLERNGYRAYLVGGVVRDFIQGKKPKDYDIATTATPDQVCVLFPRVIPTGLRHGTVKVVAGGFEIEVTTLRRDGSYSDCRRPDNVKFTRSLREDLSRRDFTINSLAADTGGRVYNFFGGVEDISAGLIRAVGDPGKRFKEDGLRMLRAVRFACQLRFVVVPGTLGSIKANCRLISRVSAERTREELNGILMSEMPGEGIDLLMRTGLMEYIFPEVAGLASLEDDCGRKGRYGDTLAVLSNSTARLNVRLSALLYNVAHLAGGDFPGGGGLFRLRRQEAPGPVEEILGRLKYDRKTVKSVSDLVGMAYTWRFLTGDVELKRFLGVAGADKLDDFFDLWMSQARASGRPGDQECLRGLKKRMDCVLAQNVPVSIKDLDLNGNDLKRMGIKPGREMGRILGRLLDVVLEKPGMNEKWRLKELVREWCRPAGSKK